MLGSTKTGLTDGRRKTSAGVTKTSPGTDADDART